MRSRNSLTRGACAAIGLALATGCTIGTPTAATSGSGLDPARSLTEPGALLAGQIDWSTRPRYHVVADLDPATGTVRGQLSATLPVEVDDTEVELFFIALVTGFANADRVEDVTVDGHPVDADVSHSLATITVPLGRGGRTTVDIGLSFSYQMDEVELSPPSSWDPDNPTVSGAGETLGLLARHEDGLSLGSWFPVHAFAATGVSSVRHTGNMPAAQFSVELSVPVGYDVITSGSRTFGQVEDGRLVVREQAFGARAFAVAVVRGLTTTTRRVGDTVLNVYVLDADRTKVEGALDDAARALGALGDAFGPYPWRELDVVSVPMGLDIGGVAWPGTVWIESTLMLSDRGVVGDHRRWALAHELAHQWWGAQILSDGHFEPVQDEALAQFAACAVHKVVWPEQGEQACEDEITGVYLEMRSSGFPDGVANKLLFGSSEQQTGLTYGKAPHALLELGTTYGEAAVLTALAEFSRTQSFGVAGDGELAEHLGVALEDPDGVAEIWHRWMLEINGDEDLDFVDEPAG